MQPHKFLIGIAAFSVIVVILFGAAVNIANNYADMGTNIDIDENESAAFNKMSNINDKAESIESGITGTDVGGESSSTTFLGGAWSAISIVFSSLSVTKDIIEGIGTLFHLHPLLTGFAITAVILSVLFMGVYMLFQSKGE